MDPSFISQATSSTTSRPSPDSAVRRNTWVPMRHGAHWPQLSPSKNSSWVRTASRRSRVELRATTPAEPSIAPTSASALKSKARPRSDAGRKPLLAPPG